MHKETVYHQPWYADDYDREKFGNDFGRYLRDREVALYLSLVDGSYQSVVDVGAGTGKLSVPLLRESRRVMAVDASGEMLRIAQAKAREEGLDLETRVCDAHQLPFEDRQFDCAVSSRMLMHLANWKHGLAELCRVSRQAVVLDFPPLFSSSGPGALVRKLRKPFQDPLAPTAQAYTAFIVESVVREVEGYGFKVVTLRKEYFLSVAVHRVLNRPEFSARLESLCRTLGLVRLMGAPVTLKAVRK